MKIIIAGGSGFIGRKLEKYFESNGNVVKVLTRSPKEKNDVLWDGKSLGYWVSELDCADVLINMAGKSVDCRYHQKNKDLILSSRIDSTQVLQSAMNTVKNPPNLWINSSTATIYKHSLNLPNDEKSGVIGSGFSVNVAKAWEKEFFLEKEDRIRKVALRSAIVLGENGGALKPLIGLAKKGLGGKQGDGKQMVSWIHEDDLCRIIDFIIENKDIEGVVNASAPNPIRNNNFNAALRNAIPIKLGVPTPAFLVKIGTWFMRTEAELVLKSRYVLPSVLLGKGYRFKYENIEEALESIVRKAN